MCFLLVLDLILGEAAFVLSGLLAQSPGRLIDHVSPAFCSGMDTTIIGSHGVLSPSCENLSTLLDIL